MGKKKPFIDRKRASSYTLLHRSQRDVAAELAEGDTRAWGTVLWPQQQPSPSSWEPNSNNLAATDRAVQQTAGSHDQMAAWRARLGAAGLLDVDHERYLKPVTGEGTFLDARTGRATVLVEGASNGDQQQQPQQQQQQHSAEDALLEVHRQFDSIPLTAEFMDEDVAEALFGDFDEGDFEELNDDFVLDAAAEPRDGSDSGAASFDFDEHIQRLMAKAAAERRQESSAVLLAGGGGETENVDRAYFANLTPLHERDDESFSNDDHHHPAGTVATEPGVVAKLNPDEERALCEKFEATLAEYDEDSDDDDDDDEHYAEYEGGDDCGGGDVPPQGDLHGGRPLEGDAVIEAALDDFLQEKEDDIFIKGTARRHHHHPDDEDHSNPKRQGGSGFSVLVGTRMVPARELDAAEDHPEQEPAVPVGELLARARERLARPQERPPAEEIFIDGKSYFSERERNRWDCESVLSTYSNLDNNPTTIGAGASRRRRQQQRKKKAQQPATPEEGAEPVQHIRLSAKTGLPMGVLDSRKPQNGDGAADEDDDDFDDTFVSINRGEARNRNESAAEKKARKLLVKRERELARMQKKLTRQVYAEEFQKRHGVEADDTIAGKTVIRFS